MADKDREFLLSWAMSWDDISDAQLVEVISRAGDERARAIVGKLRAYYRDKAAGRIQELEKALELKVEERARVPLGR